MSNIVERLRTNCGSPYCVQLRAEAADKIERLTTVNEQALERGRAAIMQQTVLDQLQADNERLRAVLKEAREFIATHPTIPDGHGWYQRVTLETIDAAIALHALEQKP